MHGITGTRESRDPKTSRQRSMPGTPKRHTKHDKRPLVGAELEYCIYCDSTDITRAGKRYKQHEILQRWFCHTCNTSFTQRRAGKGSTYPLKVILEVLCHFYVGHTLEHTTHYINRRFGLSLNSRTLSRWLNAYRDLTTYDRLREKGRQHFTPHVLVRSTRLHH